jgi:hypothetical protein
MRNPLYPKIESKIPQFITNEYPAAHKLIVDFYKWLESDKNFIRVLTEFREGQEVNKQIEPYVDLIISELGWFFNRPITINKSALVSTLKDFYLSRGSENSFKYLFKVLFGEDVAISYPREYLFTLSNSNYSRDHWVLTTATNFGTGLFEKIINSNSLSLTITGQTSGTSLSITKIIPIIYDGTHYLKILVSETELDFKPIESVIISDGEFSIFETIFASPKLVIDQPGRSYKPGDIVTINGATIKGFAKVKSTTRGDITGITIINPGQGYAVGDRIKTRLMPRGAGFFATVRKVGPNGEIEAFKIWSTGYDYEEIPPLVVESETGSGAELVATSTTIGGIKKIDIIDQFWLFNLQNLTTSVSSSTGTGASISINASGCISRDVSTYKNQRGVLETNCILHDSDYFQNYSYEIQSRVASAHFDSAVDDMLHPVGYKRYSVYMNEFVSSLSAITEVLEIIIAIKLDQPIAYMPTMSWSLENVAYMDQRKNSTLFSINNIDLLKFSDNFNYINDDFKDLSIQLFDERSDKLESRTIDPEISIVTNP